MTATRQVNKWLVTLAVMLPTVMEVIDTSVANVALPHMQGSLNAGTDEITWVLTSYLVSNAVVLPMTGWLARMFGRKRFLLTCIVLFTVTSFLCGAAPTLETLILFRVLQGAAGGALIPMSQAIVMEAFPLKERGMAMAVFGVGAMFGPVIGPALGGWVTDNINWRWIFYINVPFGILAVILVSYFVFDPEYLKQRMRTLIDYWGLALLCIGLGALQIVLDKGQLEDWFSSSFIVVFSAIALLALVALVFVELRQPHPIVNLRLFRSPTFAIGNFLMFLFGFCLYGAVVMIPLFLQTLMGYNATLAGLVLAPGGVATLLTMPLVGAALRRMDSRLFLVTGFATSAVALFIMQGFNLEASLWDFVWPRIILGCGFGMIFVPLSTTTLSVIAREEMGNATGMYNLLRNIGGSVGIAVCTTWLARYGQFYQNHLIAHINPYSPVFQQRFAALQETALAKGGMPGQVESKVMALLYGEVGRQAGVQSYNRIFWLLGIMYIAMIPLVLLLKREKTDHS
jgi:DHA2 family multidrug resistance protein